MRGNSTGHNGFANHCLALPAEFNETEQPGRTLTNDSDVQGWEVDLRRPRCSLKTLVDADVRVVREERNSFQPRGDRK